MSRSPAVLLRMNGAKFRVGLTPPHLHLGRILPRRAPITAALTAAFWACVFVASGLIQQHWTVQQALLLALPCAVLIGWIVWTTKARSAVLLDLTVRRRRKPRRDLLPHGWAGDVPIEELAAAAIFGAVAGLVYAPLHWLVRSSGLLELLGHGDREIDDVRIVMAGLVATLAVFVAACRWRAHSVTLANASRR